MGFWEIAAWIVAIYYVGAIAAAAIAGRQEQVQGEAYNQAAKLAYVILWPVWLVIGPVVLAFSIARNMTPTRGIKPPKDAGDQ